MRARVRRWLEQSGSPAENPAQLLAYGLAGGDDNDKSNLVERLLAMRPSELYRAAYERWEALVQTRKFAVARIRARDRVFHGLGDAGVAETNAVLHSLYGMPLLRDSSLKGLALAYAKKLESTGFLREDQGKWLFGTPDAAGNVYFHDAWWVPDSAGPLVREVDTPHHQDYYGSRGAKPATDFDNPVPVAQLAITGEFLVAVEGDEHAARLALGILKRAATEWGFGGRVLVGYGRFSAPA
jgi:CRISPR-associated protein Cmr6